MQYIISFIEGIITFISPCLLPMLPIYVSYFAGGGERKTRKTAVSAAGFVLGFTVMFMLMGALAGTLGSFLIKYQAAVNIICGIIMILFGLNYMGLLKINLFSGIKSKGISASGFFSSFVFGLIFSVGWTPCVGAFLGSALLLASQQGSTVVGLTMLLCYSLGLGIPFFISAILIDSLKGAFAFIKRNYKIINMVCGILLVAVGILMATGLLGRLLTLFS